MRIPLATPATLAAGLALVSLAVGQASAAILITEVQPSASGNAPYAADWFEITNTGGASVSLAGWRIDDNSNSFTVGAALNGVSSIGAGESVVFVEGSAATASAFLLNWFGTSPPSGLQVGYYSVSGIGLSTTSDAVNIFNASGVLQANVTFGVADATSPFSSFDNTAGVNNGGISLLSQIGVNGAFAAATSPEIGSPGLYAPPAPVPLPAAGLLLLGSLGSLLPAGLRRRRKAA